MNHRFTLAAVAATILTTTAADAALLTTTQRNCLRRIMLESRDYVRDIGTEMRATLTANLVPQSRFCGSGRKCIGGSAHGGTCTTNAGCPGGGCYPNLFNGSGFSRRIVDRQNAFKRGVFNSCTAAGVTPAQLLYPSDLCSTPAPGPMNFDQVVDCVLRNNASFRGHASIVDTTFEPYRRVATHFPVPHPPDYTTYPSAVCGVPGSYLWQFASESLYDHVGRQGLARPLQMDGCVGDVCQTKGESVADFGGNMWDDPITTYAGPIPICLVSRATDVFNGTTEDGFIDLSSGDQETVQRIAMTVLIGTSCPKCVTNTGLCDSGARAGLPCLHRGSEDIACPPTIAGSPPVALLKLSLTTSTVTISVPPNNPSGGASNPAGAFCGYCDLDDSFGCQNDNECVTEGLCSGGFVGSGCCVFDSNTGFANEVCDPAPPAASLTLTGATGPFIPHLVALSCLGRTGDSLLNATLGLPGPSRYVEPRFNVFAW